MDRALPGADVGTTRGLSGATSATARFLPLTSQGGLSLSAEVRLASASARCVVLASRATGI